MTVVITWDGALFSLKGNRDIVVQTVIISFGIAQTSNFQIFINILFFLKEYIINILEIRKE